jgi:protein disulfide-isomerase
MKKITIAILACFSVLQIHAADLRWGTDLTGALAKAKSDNKMVVINFTGSDWCPWCIKFDKEALDTDQFAQYAKSHLVLVLADFPNSKPQSDALKTANAAMQKKYSVDGFPTLIVLNSDGKEIGRQVGYASGGSDAFIAELQGFSKK